MPKSDSAKLQFYDMWHGPPVIFQKWHCYAKAIILWGQFRILIRTHMSNWPLAFSSAHSCIAEGLFWARQDHSLLRALLYLFFQFCCSNKSPPPYDKRLQIWLLLPFVIPYIHYPDTHLLLFTRISRSNRRWFSISWIRILQFTFFEISWYLLLNSILCEISTLLWVYKLHPALPVPPSLFWNKKPGLWSKISRNDNCRTFICKNRYKSKT